jgi:adenine-specific DNA methylase
MPSLLETQFPIAQLSLESYKERKANHGQILKPLGKWWGEKPLVLTRAIIIASLFEASSDPERWPDDLEVFLRLMCMDSAGMWKRKIQNLPVGLCFEAAREDEKDLFIAGLEKWKAARGEEGKARRDALEKRVFYSLPFPEKREYCCRVEEIDGPPEESWAEINAYCGTSARTINEWISQMSLRRFGHLLRVGDSFCGSGSIPYEAAEIGCETYASDLNPASACLAWGALNIVGGDPEMRANLEACQEKMFKDVNREVLKLGFETSEEGWRLEAALYCLEVLVPQWDGWRIPLSPTWLVAPKTKTWVELIPNPETKRFNFKVRQGGEGYTDSRSGTKRDSDIVCPQSLWGILHKDGKTQNATRRLAISSLLSVAGGLRKWEKSDFSPRDTDFYGERLYCLKWQRLVKVKRGNKMVDKIETVYREPTEHDLAVESKIAETVCKNLEEWQNQGWIPSWRIQDGRETSRLNRERGWTHWHHLFTPRQLLLNRIISKAIGGIQDSNLRRGLMLSLGKVLNQNARLSGWSPRMDVEKTDRVFVNQALNPMTNYGARGLHDLKRQLCPKFSGTAYPTKSHVTVCDARAVTRECDLWITDPPYADAVNYEEISEFFLAWYRPHIESCFSEWYCDSKRDDAVKGDDAPFRVAMAECYSRLADNMPDNGMQVLMFTHKDTDVWEDLAMIMWAAGLQVKQVWSVATETPGAGIRVGNYVQATYNMVLRKRAANAPMGFVDLVIPQIKSRVEEVIRHMRDSQVASGGLSCGYTDTDYLLAAQAVAAEVVTGFSSIDGIDLMEELRTPNKQRGASALRDLMNQAKRTATDFLVPLGLEEQLRRTPDGGSAYQFWRSLSPEEKFLLKSLELEAGGAAKVGTFQDLAKAYGLSESSELLGRAEANAARSKLPAEFSRPDATRWEDVPAGQRGEFPHSVTRQLYHALKLLGDGADAERAVKHLVETTNFWAERQTRHLVLLGYIHQATEPNEAWAEVRPLVQTLRLAVENHRG